MIGINEILTANMAKKGLRRITMLCKQKRMVLSEHVKNVMSVKIIV